MPRVPRPGVCVRGLLALVAVWPSTAQPAHGAVRDVWIAAVPAVFDVMPWGGRDPITGATRTREQRIGPTVIFRRTTRKWRRPLRNSQASIAPRDGIPGPLIRARVGDRIRVHFKNLDFATGRAHSMHFHGVRYKPDSDGAFVPGISGRDGNVVPGHNVTYRLDAIAGSEGVWPYHDHGPHMHESIEGGMYGALSIAGRRERRPDREFVVVFNPLHDFESINNRAFIRNTPTFRSRAGDLVQWDVVAMGSSHHTFHVHGHRWRDRDGTALDTRTVGPAESFRVRWVERDPGTWLYHCHREDHMERGMIGLYEVAATHARARSRQRRMRSGPGPRTIRSPAST